MSERKPGFYIATDKPTGEHAFADYRDPDMVKMRFEKATKDFWSHPAGPIEWGPRILPNPDLVQIRREELDKLRELEYLCRHPEWQPLAAIDVLDRLDALRREVERDG